MSFASAAFLLSNDHALFLKAAVSACFWVAALAAAVS